VGAPSKLFAFTFSLSSWSLVCLEKLSALNPITFVDWYLQFVALGCAGLDQSQEHFFFVTLVLALAASDCHCAGVVHHCVGPSTLLLWSCCFLTVVMVVLVYIVITQLLNFNCLGLEPCLLDVRLKVMLVVMLVLVVIAQLLTFITLVELLASGDHLHVGVVCHYVGPITMSPCGPGACW